MSILLILTFVGIVIFISHSIEAITGFGGVILAFPFVLAIMGDIEKSKIILSTLSWLLAMYFAATKFKSILWGQFSIIILVSGLGLPIGIAIFKALEPATLKKILGGIIVLSSAFQLIKTFIHRNKISAIPGFLNYGFLLLGGVIHGVFASGGPFVALYATKKITKKGQFRATLSLLWATLNSVLIMQYLFEDKLTAKTSNELLFLIPFTVAGIFFGEFIHKKLDETLFRKIVFCLLLITGVIMLIV